MTLKMKYSLNKKKITSILKVFLKQYMSHTGPNNYLRGITPTKTDQFELDLEISKYCIEKSEN